MIYTRANAIGIGNPVRVYDANGLELRYLVECDTETGRVIQQARDEDGRPALNLERTHVLVSEKYYAAPLLVVPDRKR